MANVKDGWHKSRPEPGDEKCTEHGLAPTAQHNQGKRWLVQWRDGTVSRKVKFAKRADADRFLGRLGGTWCIVPKCGYTAVTEPPVLLCRDHVDMLMLQLKRQRPSVHDPLVYFIRNGTRIKIGWTTNLKSRLSSLSLPAGSVALTVPGGPQTEDEMHRRFARARVGRSEWFEAVAELEEFIAART